MEATTTPEHRVALLSSGANQGKVRAHNERLVLSLVRLHESLPKSEIARRTGLSPQAASVIMRGLERDEFLIRGEPLRGQVGQPSVPMSLNPDAVYALGLKVGRGSADLVLVNFLGSPVSRLSTVYDFPEPSAVLDFVRQGVDELLEPLTPKQRQRVSGLGIASPFLLWKWAETLDLSPEQLDGWRDFDLREAVSEVTELPTILQNDATSACSAELLFGRGGEFSDFIYFFVGTFIGGGIVLNHAVFKGRTGNAGAIGPMPTMTRDGTSTQLLEFASLHNLEKRLEEHAIDPSPIKADSEDWTSFGSVLEDWLETAAHHMAQAITSSCALIDFEAAIVDGALPKSVKARFVELVNQEMNNQDMTGLMRPQIIAGQLGADARALGGASLPMVDRYLLDTNVLFKDG